MILFAISIKGGTMMAKIPKKVLKWREKQPTGKIMKPSTAEKIRKGAEKSGATDPGAVVGSVYWPRLMKKYHESHCDAEPL
jgi:hypothetical protein